MKDQRESSASGRRSGAHGAGRWRSLVHGAALLTLVGCVGSQPVERPFSLADLPANVRVSALSAVPGIDLLRVTVRDDGEQPLFILEGYAEPNRWRIACDMDGSVQRIDRLP